jgi:hypothetical protein
MAYVKTTWIDDTLPDITAAQLNRIEQGIADAHTGLAAVVPVVKWLFVGGSEMRQERIGGFDWTVIETTTSTTYTTLTTAGPRLTVPLSGDYLLTGRVSAKTAASGGNFAGFIFWTTGDPTNTTWQQHDAGTIPSAGQHGATITGERVRTLVAGNVVELRYATSINTSAAQITNRNIYMRPVRVG